jgi:hypothetical protein
MMALLHLLTLPENPIILPEEPVPFIRDAIVQPYTSEGKVIITWITNFTDACTITVNGNSQQVSCEDIVDGYYTFHAVVEAPLGGEYFYTIEGKNGVTLTKSFAMPDNMRFLIAVTLRLLQKIQLRTGIVYRRFLTRYRHSSSAWVIRWTLSQMV